MVNLIVWIVIYWSLERREVFIDIYNPIMGKGEERGWKRVGRYYLHMMVLEVLDLIEVEEWVVWERMCSSIYMLLNNLILGG